jgi:hypothetical protein
MHALRLGAVVTSLFAAMLVLSAGPNAQAQTAEPRLVLVDNGRDQFRIPFDYLPDQPAGDIRRPMFRFSFIMPQGAGAGAGNFGDLEPFDRSGKPMANLPAHYVVKVHTVQKIGGPGELILPERELTNVIGVSGTADYRYSTEFGMLKIEEAGIPNAPYFYYGALDSRWQAMITCGQALSAPRQTCDGTAGSEKAGLLWYLEFPESRVGDINEIMAMVNHLLQSWRVETGAAR